MKKQSIILLLAVLFSLAANHVMATIRVVSNQSAYNPEIYTIIDSAIAHSSPGDTVYVQASSIGYNAVHLTKKLVLIGAGYYTTGLSNNNITTLNVILADSNSNNSVIMGFEMLTGFNANFYNTNPNNITLVRNKILNLSIKGNNWVVRNNYINGSISIYTVSNLLFENNVITNVASLTNSGAMTSCLINHNMFYTTSQISSIFNGISNTILTNNIFESGLNNIFSNVTNCSLSNNLFYNGFLGNSGAWDPNSNGGSNNSIAQSFLGDPLFTPDPAIATFNNWNFDITNTNSPAYHNGGDGTNIGPSGGSYPMTTLLTVPPIPQVTKLNVVNSIIYQGQQLNVNIKGRVRK